MSDNNLLGPWIRRFLLEHLVNERNLARNTQVSYRDTLALLVPFATSNIGKPVDRLTIENITPEIVRAFLAYLEETRGCGISTRNQRLAAIHALARFIATHSPEHIAWQISIQTVPFKKGSKASIAYLDKPEMNALLGAPDRNSAQGLRDYVLLLFLYNSGARADEAARITVGDLELGASPAVKILGKGRKTRFCPLWSLTANTLAPLISGRMPGEKVFLNRRKQPITRFGIYALVKRHVLKVGKQMPSLLAKRVSPHTIRHATAVHLLRAGVDINTIRAWLGHVSLDTTNIYAEVDLEMKAKALAHCEISGTANAHPSWHGAGLMAFLKAL
jgi:site-specific recombinase XerD